MIESLFISLNEMMESSAGWALAASFAWGVLSVLLSPCHLAGIPLIVGYISGEKELTTRRAFLLSLLFATGILVTIGLVGVITAFMGRMIGDLGAVSQWMVAGIFVLVGLILMGVLPNPLQNPAQSSIKSRGLWAALMLGLFFGLALGPCTFAFMAPVLILAFQAASKNLGFSILLLLVYGIGHCLVIVIGGTSTRWIQSLLNWNEQSRGLFWFRKVCGVCLILVGVAQLWNRL